jgi:hypothetical protein
VLAIEVLLQSFLVFTAHWAHCPYIKRVVYACLSFPLPKELDGVQTRVLVEPYSKHGAPRHSGHDRKCVEKFVPSHKTLSVTLRGNARFVSRGIKVLLLNTELKDLYYWQN